jgi:hypothetical protein
VVLCQPSRCRGADEALGVVRLLCSNTLRVRLLSAWTGLSQVPFRSLLGGEGGRLQRLTLEPGSPRAPGGHGGVCLLVSRPVCDPIGRMAGKATRKGQRLGAPEPRWLRACLLAPEP